MNEQKDKDTNKKDTLVEGDKHASDVDPSVSVHWLYRNRRCTNSGGLRGKAGSILRARAYLDESPEKEENGEDSK